MRVGFWVDRCVLAAVGAAVGDRAADEETARVRLLLSGDRLQVAAAAAEGALSAGALALIRLGPDHHLSILELLKSPLLRSQLIEEDFFREGIVYPVSVGDVGVIGIVEIAIAAAEEATPRNGRRVLVVEAAGSHSRWWDEEVHLLREIHCCLHCTLLLDSGVAESSQTKNGAPVVLRCRFYTTVEVLRQVL